MDPYKSARAVLPFVFDKWVKSPRFQPVVLDVGCGDGEWLRAAKEFGAKVCGMDQNSYVEGLDQYWAVDLRRLSGEWKPPIETRFDLSICLEVAEHLPGSAGSDLVAFLCESAPVVLFSAAHPGQGPYPPPDATPDNVGCWHIHEQPMSFWADQFAVYGFKALDVIRPRFRGDARVDPWYKANAFVAVQE